MKCLLAAAAIGLLVTGEVLGAEDPQIDEISFESHSTRLVGSLVVPKDQPVSAAVVFVQGSGKQERSLKWARRFAGQGIAALVYDKRGAGRSGGHYEEDQSVGEKNINLLADDAAAALEKLRGLDSLKNVPMGLAGISQAGWIVPIAAEKSKSAKFVLLWSGPVCKVSEEDIFSKYTKDRDADEVPSYDEALESRKEKYEWPNFLGKDSDPKDSLAKLAIPGLWIFGGHDGSIPVDLSMAGLRELKKKGFQYEYILFSELGHNNMDETFAPAADWIKRTVGAAAPGRARPATDAGPQ
jgi:uncharacterized protein